MTPNFITGLAVSTPTAVADPLALWMDDLPAVRRNLGFATIVIGARQQAQGPVLHHLRDGRVCIDAGGRVLTGRSVTPKPAPRSLWSRLSGRHPS